MCIIVYCYKTIQSFFFVFLTADPYPILLLYETAIMMVCWFT